MEQFQITVSDFNINSKLTFIVTDSAANMLKAFSLPGFETINECVHESDESDDDDSDCVFTEIADDETSQFYDDLSNISQHIPCFAHTIQLVIKDGFKEVHNIAKVLKKASTIVSFVKKSTIAADLLESEKCLRSANITRWNSQLLMLRSILRIPEDKLNSLDTVHLSTYDRNILHDIVGILTPFETATHCIQGDRVVTSSMVVPCVRVLKKTLQSLSDKFSSRFVTQLCSSLDKRLTCYEESDTFLTAAALDPRFKLKWCTNAEADNLESKLIDKVKQANPSSSEVSPVTSTNSPSATTANKKETLSFFDSVMTSSSSNSENKSPSDIDSIVKKYLYESCLPQEVNPLTYWKSHATPESEFECLSKVALKYLCIPASSAPVERIFSIAGKVFRPERCRLKDKTFEELMFIKCNLNCLK